MKLHNLFSPGAPRMRFSTLALLAFLIPAPLSSQVVITDVGEDETTQAAQPTPRPRVTVRPRGTLSAPPAGTFRPSTSGISIEETTGPAVTPPSDEPITITPAPGSTRRPRRTPAPAPGEVQPPPATATPMPAPAVPAAGQAAAPQADDSFLPRVPAVSGSPVVVRGGQKLPLRPEQLTARPLDLTVPEVNETTLSNGMRLYHYRSTELPRVSFHLLINAGKNLDPADKVGLADLTARTLRSGGTAELDADQVDRQLEQLGSDLDVSAEREYVTARLFALKDNAGKALDLLADLMTSPALDAGRLEQQRALALEEVRRENDNPSEIGRREFRKLIYGPDHPLARTPTSASLSAITRDDVADFYQKYYRPSSILIGVAGDVTLEEAKQLVEASFGHWKTEPAVVPPVPPLDADRDTSPAVVLIRKPTAQSQIRVGHLGIPRHTPEQYAVAVLNNVYGTGGFSSRLMNVVRTQHGYAYGTGGALLSDNPRGLFFAAAGSKANTTAAAIRAIIQVTKDLLNGTISPDEIETAKRDVIFSFFTGLDTPGEIVATYMQYDFLGYPDDFLKTYTDRIRAVKAEDLIKAARKYIHPDRLQILVVGNEAEFDAPLSEFGPVKIVELE